MVAPEMDPTHFGREEKSKTTSKTEGDAAKK
jgi:hypothetical protein